MVAMGGRIANAHTVTMFWTNKLGVSASIVPTEDYCERALGHSAPSLVRLLPYMSVRTIDELST